MRRSIGCWWAGPRSSSATGCPPSCAPRASSCSGAGAEITAVSDGNAALEALRAGTPQIIVAEVRWPAGSGLSILEAARRMHPRAPVILFSGQPSVGEAVRAMQEGADTYLPRPLG